MTIKELKEKIADLPDDMKVAVHVGLDEANGAAHAVEVIEGDSKCPYNKGDNPYQNGEFQEDEKVCFIFG